MGNRGKQIQGAIFAVVGLTICVLSARGQFQSAAMFPLVFGAIWGLLGIAQAVVWRRERLALVLTLVGAAAGLAAPAFQGMFLRAQAARAETAALAGLSGVAPPLEWRWSIPEATDAGQFDDRVTVVNFWATWCNPCVEELPALEAFAREHADSNLSMVGFTRLWAGGEDEAARETELQEIREFLSAHGVSYLNLVEDGEATHSAYGVTRWPSTALIASDGRVVDFGVGLSGSKRILNKAAGLLVRNRS